MPTASCHLGISSVVPIVIKDERIILLDQRKLPDEVKYFDATKLDDMCFAIKDMVVRGAPAIGAAAALSLAYEAKRLASISGLSNQKFIESLVEAKAKLQATRPTAVNLSWDTNLVYISAYKNLGQKLEVVVEQAMQTAKNIITDYENTNRLLGENGAKLIGKKSSALTHCNAGALAACGWGTALGVIRAIHCQNKQLKVFVDETRPRQQGARLTAWELLEDDITPTLICDSMAGYLMSKHKIDFVIVGADRIALNGDTANKIGTYTLAVLANYHQIPFYIAAPLSTFDPEVDSGNQIPIEEREFSEVTMINQKNICPSGVEVINPAFDVTPYHMISAFITEAGIIRPPFANNIAEALSTRKLA